jgi:hypothetical protein
VHLKLGKIINVLLCEYVTVLMLSSQYLTKIIPYYVVVEKNYVLFVSLYKTN